MCVCVCYRVVGLIDAEDEDDVGDEERAGAVGDDAGLVAVKCAHTREDDDGEEEETQRHPHTTPRDQLHRKNLSVLNTQTQHSERE